MLKLTSAESEQLLNNSTILRKYLDFLTEAYFPPHLSRKCASRVEQRNKLQNEHLIFGIEVFAIDLEYNILYV